MIAWDVSATSGMAGADIDAEFVKGLDEKELLYLMDKILMAYRLCQSEYVKKCEASRG